MTTIALAPSFSRRALKSRRAGLVAGATYVSAWLVGLALKPTGPALDAPPAEISSHYAAHGTVAAAQSLLIHGVAAAALAVVAVAVARRAEGWTQSTTLFAGATAAFLSVAQMAFGLVAATNTDAAPAMFEALNRLDGVKMLALAAFAVSGAELARQRTLPRWLAPAGVLASATLLPAAVGYLTLNPTLALAATPALLLLLVFVGGAGVTSGRR